MASPITQVPQGVQAPMLSQLAFDASALIELDVRGTQFSLRREELTALPESILLCLFPVGLLVDDDDTPIRVDFDPDALRYVLEFFRAAAENPAGSVGIPSLIGGKAAIIVLKEDLDFYIIPSEPVSEEDARALRRSAGRYLVSADGIFGGLRKSTQNGSVGAAEQHLIDMLCASGFDREDAWAKRYVEPNRACVTSIALALLRPSGSSRGSDGAGSATGSVNNAGSRPGTADAQVQSSASQPGSTATATTTGSASSSAAANAAAAAAATSQKLLLFWRKPARKCWWDACTPTSLEDATGAHRSNVKVWARRVWTLELSITG